MTKGEFEKFVQDSLNIFWPGDSSSESPVSLLQLIDGLNTVMCNQVKKAGEVKYDILGRKNRHT